MKNTLKNTMKRLFAIALCITMLCSLVPAAFAIEEPTTQDPTVLTVINTSSDDVVLSTKEYTAAALAELAETSPVGYQFWKNGTENLLAATEYVTIDALLADAGIEFTTGDSLMAAAADGFSSTASYADLATYKYYITSDGSTDVPAVLALSWDTGTGSLAEVAATAYNSGNIRFCYGISEAQYAQQSAAGKRLASKVVTVTVTHCAHANTELKNVAEATCEKDGYSGDTYCADCGKLLGSGTAIAALGHAWDAGTVTTEPTETEKGVMTYTCTRCAATRTEELPVTAPIILPFTDVPDEKWFYSAVKFAYLNELFEGTSTTTFNPDGTMTRAMLVTVLWRLDGKTPAEKANTFSDVSEKQWYTDAVSWAAENEIVTGVGDNKFNPNGNVTREQIAVILFRYAKFKGCGTDKTADLSKFPDSDKVSAWAKDATSWANAEGLINGTAKNSTDYLDPQAAATRAQVAEILMRYVQNVVSAK